VLFFSCQDSAEITVSQNQQFRTVSCADGAACDQHGGQRHRGQAGDMDFTPAQQDPARAPVAASCRQCFHLHQRQSGWSGKGGQRAGTPSLLDPGGEGLILDHVEGGEPRAGLPLQAKASNIAAFVPVHSGAGRAD
jgi:hypothetical protein